MNIVHYYCIVNTNSISHLILIQEHQRSAHGVSAQVHAWQLDERVQEVVSNHQSGLSHR